MPASDIWQHASASHLGGGPMSVGGGVGDRSVSTTHVYEHHVNGRGGGAVTDSDVYRYAYVCVPSRTYTHSVGVYGWRKRCLYAFILFLTVVIVINLSLTVWIMSVLDFTTVRVRVRVLAITFGQDGMGALKLVDDGIRVTGKAEFDKPVHFRQISTKQGVPLTIESDHGLYLNARNSSGQVRQAIVRRSLMCTLAQVTSRLSLEPDGSVHAVCERFEVRNTDRQLLFFTDKNEVGVRVENLRIIDDGGTVFEGAIQTSVIRPEPDSPLRYVRVQPCAITKVLWTDSNRQHAVCTSTQHKTLSCCRAPVMCRLRHSST
jgi:hypothetical protein